MVDFNEGKEKKGGINKRPINSPPPPPKGQGGSHKKKCSYCGVPVVNYSKVKLQYEGPNQTLQWFKPHIVCWRCINTLKECWKWAVKVD
jgi:hypothetical protein